MSGSYTVQPSDWDPCDGLFSGHSDGTVDYTYAQDPERPWLNITYRWAYNTDRSAWLLSGDPIAKDFIALLTRSTKAITDPVPRPHRAAPLRSIPHVQALSGIMWYYALVPSWARYNHTQFWPGSDGHVYGAVHRVRTQPGVSFDGSTFTPTAGEPFYYLGQKHERGIAPDFVIPPQYEITVPTTEAAPHALMQWMLYLMVMRMRKAAARNGGWTQHYHSATLPRAWDATELFAWRANAMPYYVIDENAARHTDMHSILLLSLWHAYSYERAIGPARERLWMSGIPGFRVGKVTADPIARRAVVYGMAARSVTRQSNPAAFAVPSYAGNVDETREFRAPISHAQVGYRITVRRAIRRIVSSGKVLLQVGRPNGWLTLTEDGEYVGPTQGTYSYEYALGYHDPRYPEIHCLIYDPQSVCYVQRGAPDQWIRGGGKWVFLLGAQDRAGMGDYVNVDENTIVAGYSGFLGSLDSGARLDIAGPGGLPVTPVHERGTAWSGVYYEDSGQARFEIPVPPDAPPAQYTITRLGDSVGDIADAAASTQACVGLPIGSVTGMAYVLSYDGMYYWDDAHDPPLVPAEPEDKVFYNLYGINGRPWTPS